MGLVLKIEYCVGGQVKLENLVSNELRRVKLHPPKKDKKAYAVLMSPHKDETAVHGYPRPQGKHACV